MMSEILAVSINDVVHLEYDRRKTLPDQQHYFLDRMDKELQSQIVMGNEVITNPDLHERAQFVAINLVNALKASEDSLAAAMCAYLAERVPDLKQVKVTDRDGQLLIDLVFDEDYVRQVNVEFMERNTKPVSH
ncbi:MAG: hypothetical protein PVJ39_03635 [Gammaproteobacteria bacterium]|jgi:hypothetical protein